MAERKIGVISNSFGLGTEDGIRKAAELGLTGFQIYCTGGDMAPANMDTARRKEFKQFVADQGLVLSALCADFGRGFINPQANDETVAMTAACMELAADLGTEVVTSHIGHLPDDTSAETYQSGLAAMAQLAECGKATGVKFASETGPESADALKAFLDAVGSEYIGVNYDPANLCMGGFDQIGGVKILAPYIFHTHAKDGLKGEMKEVPLGEGGVDFPKYIAELDAVGYDGFLTIERECGEDRIKDITTAANFLRSL